MNKLQELVKVIKANKDMDVLLGTTIQGTRRNGEVIKRHIYGFDACDFNVGTDGIGTLVLGMADRRLDIFTRYDSLLNATSSIIEAKNDKERLTRAIADSIKLVEISIPQIDDYNPQDVSTESGTSLLRILLPDSEEEQIPTCNEITLSIDVGFESEQHERSGLRIFAEEHCVTHTNDETNRLTMQFATGILNYPVFEGINELENIILQLHKTRKRDGFLNKRTLDKAVYLVQDAIKAY